MNIFEISMHTQILQTSNKIKKVGILPKIVENSRLMVYIYIHKFGCKTLFREL
jgi:hypothetical protein